MTRRIGVLVLGMLFLGISSTAEPDRPEIDRMLPLLADLAAQGSYGIRNTEHAAFIVREGSGELRCILWPFSGEFQRASYDAPMPEGVIAIAHTHPRCCREASAHDSRQAERLSIPVIAVSMGTLSAVDHEGRRWESRRGISWSRHADAERRCTQP